MFPEPQGQTEQTDTSNVHHIDTTGLTVQEWEAIKTQFARDGWSYAPHLMVLVRPSPTPDSTPEAPPQ
jgi:hypothetical protein